MPSGISRKNRLLSTIKRSVRNSKLLFYSQQKKMRNLSIRNFFKFLVCFCFYFLPILYKTSGSLLLKLPQPPWAGRRSFWAVRRGDAGGARYSGNSTCLGAARWPLRGDTGSLCQRTGHLPGGGEGQEARYQSRGDSGAGHWAPFS